MNDPAALDAARQRVAELTERVERQREIVARLKEVRGDPSRAERLLKLLETELADAKKRVADLFTTRRPSR